MYKVLLIPSFLIISLMSRANDVNSDNLNIKNSNICNAKVEFLAPIKENRSTLELSTTVSLDIIQKLSVKTLYGSNLASNFICQKLSGVKYTGSEQEWEGYFKNTANTLSAKGAKNLKLTVIGDIDTAYKGNMPHREYKFRGNFVEGDQVIYNLAVLNLAANEMYTISVSGYYKTEKRVLMEFKRLVSSLSL
jgi:hypothetical protein